LQKMLYKLYMEQRWFYFENQRVSGPWSKQQVIDLAQAKPDGLIWGKGQVEWIPYQSWQQFVTQLEHSLKTENINTERLWKLRVGEFEIKPMPYDQMVEFLKTKPDLSEVYIWTEGYSEWKQIYQIHKIMDELGVSRRAHPRVPIMGTLTCEAGDKVISVKTISISEGGLGVTEAKKMSIGEKYKAVLNSPNLYAPIHATVEVMYVGSDDYAGLKFVGIHSEAKSSIIEYVKKFTEMKRG